MQNQPLVVVNSEFSGCVFSRHLGLFDKQSDPWNPPGLTSLSQKLDMKQGSSSLKRHKVAWLLSYLALLEAESYCQGITIITWGMLCPRVTPSLFLPEHPVLRADKSPEAEPSCPGPWVLKTWTVVSNISKASLCWSIKFKCMPRPFPPCSLEADCSNISEEESNSAILSDCLQRLRC